MPDYPTFALTGQVALVTGAARGLGRAIALALADAGADVALGLREDGTADDLIAEIEAMGRHAIGIQMDVTRLEQLAPAVETVVAQFGRLDILVNNAGIGPRTRGGRRRGGLRPDAGSQCQRHVLRQPGGGPSHDPPGRRCGS